ncbi:uncharacterized protein LOC126908393 [Daktulosphaira vitifoliae]|uniref:uncharacterized protein LOC126908393 n=1 Tax=Daktulosphaira vitifoliae TaxID=58002 RepID=UPI0021AAAEC3|nr:uncharacterized protein LOC126908393 [Daktulosphaira vitifoliae]
MNLSKLSKLCFLLLCVIIYTKAKLNNKLNSDKLKTLLRYSGWKKLNDVNSIIYSTNTFYLQNLIKTPVLRYNCNKKVRGLTIFLGCTYSKVMQNLFSIIINYQQKCDKILNIEYDVINGYNCIEKLINIISLFIVPMAKLMKEAMIALDMLHNIPWGSDPLCDKYSHKISNFVGEIETIHDKLINVILKRDNISKYNSVKNFIKYFFEKIKSNIKQNTDIFCIFETYDMDYLWNGWVQEYEDIVYVAKLEFFKFLNVKIEDYIKTAIIEKYFQLGFKFDPITEETFVPTPEELIELELEFRETDEKPSMPIQIEIH